MTYKLIRYSGILSPFQPLNNRSGKNAKIIRKTVKTQIGGKSCRLSEFADDPLCNMPQ